MCFVIHLEAEVTTMSADALYVCCHARVHMQGRAMLGLKSHGNRTCSAEFGIGIYSDDASLASQCAGVRRDTWYAKRFYGRKAGKENPLHRLHAVMRRYTCQISPRRLDVEHD